MRQGNDGEVILLERTAVVRVAEKHQLGLIPSLFWHQATVSDLVNEPLDQWGNPSSRTIEFMRGYTREVVTRLKDSPAIWAWVMLVIRQLPRAVMRRVGF